MYMIIKKVNAFGNIICKYMYIVLILKSSLWLFPSAQKTCQKAAYGEKLHPVDIRTGGRRQHSQARDAQIISYIWRSFLFYSAKPESSKESSGLSCRQSG